MDPCCSFAVNVFGFVVVVVVVVFVFNVYVCFVYVSFPQCFKDGKVIYCVKDFLIVNEAFP